jgi:hypothetical protein
MKLYTFRTIPLSIIRSSFTANSAMAYVIQVFVRFFFGVSILIYFLCLFGIDEFDVRVTVHRNKFLYNKTNQMHQFHKLTLA